MKDERYCINKFHAESLENNPLGSSAEREVFIYLPPSYHDDLEKKYPVIYYLHGYSGSNKAWTITSENLDNGSVDWKKLPKKILKQIDLNRLLTFEKLDYLINEGKLEPFILVQPDGSLQVPNIHNAVDLRGNVMLKGSFYVNSPYSGNYMDYIVE
ncbi:MAG: alpha/beta hydrolase-fold protein, partial [Promethearchaeota archaeon]